MTEDPKESKIGSPSLPKAIQPTAFTIDFDVTLRMKFSLAAELADLILDHGSRNQALWALAKKIKQEDAG